jgi:dTDP-4-dehydrorhamnose 3,5-epimerase
VNKILCEIEGVIIRLPGKNLDKRGWLAELFRRDELPAALMPAMGYVSMTEPGVSRGPHEHRDQTDFFSFIGSSTFRVFLWDNRPGSTTYGKRCCFEAPSGSVVSVIVPPGVVHAYKNIGKTQGLVFNAPDRLYRGTGKRNAPDEIRYEDQSDSEFRIDDANNHFR